MTPIEKMEEQVRKLKEKPRDRDHQVRNLRGMLAAIGELIDEIVPKS